MSTRLTEEHHRELKRTEAGRASIEAISVLRRRLRMASQGLEAIASGAADSWAASRASQALAESRQRRAQ